MGEFRLRNIDKKLRIKWKICAFHKGCSMNTVAMEALNDSFNRYLSRKTIKDKEKDIYREEEESNE